MCASKVACRHKMSHISCWHLPSTHSALNVGTFAPTVGEGEVFSTKCWHDRSS